MATKRFSMAALSSLTWLDFCFPLMVRKPTTALRPLISVCVTSRPCGFTGRPLESSEAGLVMVNWRLITLLLLRCIVVSFRDACCLLRRGRHSLILNIYILSDWDRKVKNYFTPVCIFILVSRTLGTVRNKCRGSLLPRLDAALAEGDNSHPPRASSIGNGCIT